MKKAIIALLAFGAISAAAVPANASTVTVQDGRQTSVTTGNDNYTGQDSRQTTQNRSRDTSDSTGTSQASDQYTDTYGDRNVTRQDSIQNTSNDSVRNQRVYPVYR